MKTITAIRQIEAPPEVVFRVISDPRQFAEAVPGILNVEFLGEQTEGAGTRFRETREMQGKPQSVDLEIAELEPDRRVRMVSDAGGAIWDSEFVLQASGDHTEMTMTMDARPYKLAAKLLTPMIMGSVRKAVEADMDSIADYCRQQAKGES